MIVLIFLFSNLFLVFCWFIIISMVFFSVVFEIVMVLDSECKMLILIVLFCVIVVFVRFVIMVVVVYVLVKIFIFVFFFFVLCLVVREIRVKCCWFVNMFGIFGW